MNDLTKYEAIRDKIVPGDIFIFDGSNTQDLVSIVTEIVPNLIEFMTWSNVSHVAMATSSDYMIESTVIGKKNGPQVNSIHDRLESYDGRVWFCPLSEHIRGILNISEVLKFLYSKVGVDHYSYKSLIDFVIRKIPIIGSLPFFHKADKDSEVCSEFLAKGLVYGGIPGLKPNEITPQGFAELKIYKECIQLIGTPAGIKKFNSL